MRKISLLIGLVAMLLMSGCSQKVRTVSNIGTASHINATQMSMFQSMSNMKNKTLVFTSLVDVDNFKQSSDFGRLYTDLMMTQLEHKGWNIVDFRGQSVISKSRSGEFYLDRSNFKSIPKDASVFVGTYGEYRDGLLLNLRILRMADNMLVSSSSILLRDSEALAMAQKDNCKDLACRAKKTQTQKINTAFAIKMVQDDCVLADDCSGVK